MTKKETFERIIRYEVIKALQETYQMPTTDLTDRQNSLVDKITDRIFNLFGDSLTVKDLQERIQ